MIGTLIRCIECNEVINMTEWDYSPHYAWYEGEIKEQDSNDRQDFLQRHESHKTEELIPLTPPISDKPYAEPLKISYFEATNGKRRFLIKRWRSKIDDPYTYESIDGCIALTNGKVRAQTEAIKKQMKAENNSAISEEKLNCFVKAIQKEVENLDPDTLAVSAEGETPLISYYQLGSDCVDRILTRCQDSFDRHELKLLRDFVIEHNEYDDVMTLVAKKEFTIKKEAQKDEIPRAVRPAQHISRSNP
ncbi:MAG: hypothetical protein A2Y65_08905 [Deltaproteobacteria bacterium RBG_13_52_11]|nr:MAG: hypothetical protein A2Y65_08905 [Deltaproteobacteria bacterium RBG_13_52_11]